MEVILALFVILALQYLPVIFLVDPVAKLYHVFPVFKLVVWIGRLIWALQATLVAVNKTKYQNLPRSSRNRSMEVAIFIQGVY